MNIMAKSRKRKGRADKQPDNNILPEDQSYRDVT